MLFSEKCVRINNGYKIWKFKGLSAGSLLLCQALMKIVSALFDNSLCVHGVYCNIDIYPMCSHTNFALFFLFTDDPDPGVVISFQQ